MSERPDKARASVRPDGPSRRTLIAGATGAPLFAGAASAHTDQAVTACENWLTLDAERNRLSRRWQKLETQLAREHNFLKLSRRQQRKLPQAQELYEIDDRLEEVWEEQEALLKILPTLVATSAFGLAGKLAVAATHVCKDENEEGHRLDAHLARVPAWRARRARDAHGLTRRGRAQAFGDDAERKEKAPRGGEAGGALEFCLGRVVSLRPRPCPSASRRARGLGFDERRRSPSRRLRHAVRSPRA